MVSNIQENILKSIVSFLITNENNNASTIDLYNKWSVWSNIMIMDDEMMENCLYILGYLKTKNIEVLKENII